MRLASALGAALVTMATASAAKAIEITYPDANPTLVRPSSGSVSYVFDATIAIDPGYFANRISLTGAANSVTETDNIVDGFSPQLDAWFDTSNTTPSISYFGPIFTIDVNASDPLGLYDYTLAGPLPYFLVNENNGVNADGQPTNDGTNQEAIETFTITLVSATAPEPATWVQTILGLGAVGLVLRARGRRGRVIGAH